jgi:hypothetical protein
MTCGFCTYLYRRDTRVKREYDMMAREYDMVAREYGIIARKYGALCRQIQPKIWLSK